MKAAYLETLTVGEHTLTALFDDGNKENKNEKDSLTFVSALHDDKFAAGDGVDGVRG